MATKKDGARNKPAQTSNKAKKSAETKQVGKVNAPDHNGKTDFPIVGIGSSAGGLEALQELFTHMSSDTGMGFVVVSHLDPSHISILPELIKKCTVIPVHQAEDRMAVQPDNIYVIPPNKRMGILNGTLILLDLLEPHLLRLPIDFFLRNLAQDRKRKAISIILSGSGSDGALGLKEIKGEGGLVIVQDPVSARYNGMPNQAIGTGLADFVLRPSEIPARLVSLTEYSKKLYIKEVPPPNLTDLDYLGKIFLLLRQHTRHDFSQYKTGTLQRRIERRMTVNQIDNVDSYVTFLEQHKGEAQALFKDLLISVTGFFRDQEAFEALKNHLKTLISQKPKTLPFRIWVPGCATGEEAYSATMILKECLAGLNQDLEIQVFATDLDGDALERGRSGIYPLGISLDVSAERLHAFFLQVGDTYVIKNEIRDRVVFAVQDFIKDPPFSKVDLICCRNLLIYLNNDLQMRLLALIHYSLNKGGLLFLGTAETTGKQADLFSTLDNKWKIYQRREVTLQHQPMQQFGPVFTQGERRQAVGQTAQDLEPRSGPLKMNILNLDREGFRVELELALHKAFLKGQETGVAKIEVKKPEVATTAKGARSTRSSERVKQLEKELAVSLSDLQILREENETSSEELKSTNEELQSTNEEMQSTNEELETSREELQSINEELVTVNAEQTAKNDELDKASNDLLNLLNSTQIATIFLDNDLNIQRFTPAATRVFNLLESDIGRPMHHITSNLIYDQLTEDLNRVLDTLVSKSIEVHTRDADLYVLRILPYRTRQGVIQGLVLNLVDITPEVKAALELAQVKAALELAQVKAALELAESLVNTVREPLIVLDADLRVISANTTFYKNFQVTKEDTVKQFIYDVGNRQWDIPRLRGLLEDILIKNTFMNDYEVEHSFPTIGLKKMLLNARRVVTVSGQKPLILLAIGDITERK
jgi:two-component system, chemotaxis family, CheB/CheR fusion protein